MALSSELNRQTYTASAGQTIFPFTLPFFDATTISGVKYGDIKVYREEADGTLTSLTANENPAAGQFKITAGNPADGCIVTLGFSADAGDTIVIERDVAYTQEYDLQEGSTIDPTALNKALDRVVAQNQQQNDLFTRTVEFPVTDSGLTYTVGSATSRANKALGFDASGNVTELDIAEEGGFSVNTNAGVDLTAGQLSAKIDGVTTEFSGGNIAVKNAGISANKLATDSVETNKIVDDSVTYAKMQDVATSNSVLGNSATGEVTERALVGDILVDDDTMSNPSDQKGATQESIKAYVDSKQVQYFHLQETATDNGITIAANDYTTREIASVYNNITGASVDGSYEITLPAGTYKISGYATVRGDGLGTTPHQTSFRNTTDNTTAVIGASVCSLGESGVDNQSPVPSPIQGVFTIAQSKTFIFRTFKDSSNSISAGFDTTAVDEVNVYADLLIEKLV